MKKLIVIGNDKIGGLALSYLTENPDLVIYIDRSTNIKRVKTLVLKGVVSMKLILKMFLAEILRSNKKPPKSFNGIKKNNDLIRVIKKIKPEVVILFRAGLIINKSVINLGVPILNIHCAKVPEYGGLGSIQKALNEKVFSQEASLHHVIEKIDGGKVIYTEQYDLNPKESYFENENTAYLAGIKLLSFTISNIEKYDFKKKT
jgi:folate-dependent phosphoribosylglycinamide formyltransferase PurN